MIPLSVFEIEGGGGYPECDGGAEEEGAGLILENSSSRIVRVQKNISAADNICSRNLFFVLRLSLQSETWIPVSSIATHKDSLKTISTLGLSNIQK